MKLPAVNACIEIISDSVAKMPIYLMDGETRERVPDHPAVRLLTGRPTEALTAFDYHKLMESRRIAYGNAYALILRDKWGQPMELLPIAPGYMLPILDTNAKLWYVGINPKTHEYRKFWPTDVLHYKAFSTDGLEGISYLRRGAETIEAALQAQRYESNYYRNGGQVSGILTTDTDLSPRSTIIGGEKVDIKSKIRAEWESIHSGADNAYRIAVLDNGLKYTPLTATNRDAQFIETRLPASRTLPGCLTSRFTSSARARRAMPPTRRRPLSISSARSAQSSASTSRRTRTSCCLRASAAAACSCAAT